ncbi:MAG: sigma 54-interacting transcriptional regulator [Clostridia bacterium]|nr:sigma 54-interacting transcriptional regulator [Clostridia bacterium]
MRIACLLMRKEMVDQAWRVMLENRINWQEYNMTFDYGPADYAIEWTKRIADSPDKPDIIISRGLSATYVKQNCAIPVVEMRMTAQEMSLLILKAKKLSGKEHPRIGVIGYSNQYCNMDYFNEIFGIDLHLYLVAAGLEGPQELHAKARGAISDGMDVIIGGNVAQSEARLADVPSLFIETTGDSFLEAFRQAKSMSYAIRQEQLNTTWLRTLLDNSFNAIICMDTEGKVTLVNHIAGMQLGLEPENTVGKTLDTVVPELTADTLIPVLKEGKTIFSLYLDIGMRSMVANISPIMTDTGIVGAVLSAQQVKFLEEMEAAVRQHQRANHPAEAMLKDIGEPSGAVRHALTRARHYAASEFPVLINSEAGNAQERFAQAIHNQSKRSDGPFVAVNCAGIPAEEQARVLFGPLSDSEGLVSAANGGTLYIEDIQALSPVCQQRLVTLIKKHTILDADCREKHISVRLIAHSRENLYRSVQEMRFDRELFYLINSLPLDLPPLRERREDIPYWVDLFLVHYRERYKRYITLTAGGKQQMMSYDWLGNVTQLRAFCQQMILSARQRLIDEVFIRTQYSWMYPPIAPSEVSPLTDKGAYANHEAELIAQLLAQYQNNRSRVAAAMNISTTTLWRKIKKYGLSTGK